MLQGAFWSALQSVQILASLPDDRREARQIMLVLQDCQVLSPKGDAVTSLLYVLPPVFLG
ncbi:protein of unknown function [Acidithiobacillus ferrivorans]|uniref:Uncharacterized protein n=1 Tax=Acidithiobacillus ferrivorans TaxID=160808 RepID=A0A1B9BVH1_9PROT|nr:hypothetical protein BBC27_02205 [Acidithiobacillus ferrivorans]SMH66859.1 protein of unknown function [Acidithiobacillus ferrivorans]